MRNNTWQEQKATALLAASLRHNAIEDEDELIVFCCGEREDTALSRVAI